MSKEKSNRLIHSRLSDVLDAIDILLDVRKAFHSAEALRNSSQKFIVYYQLVVIGEAMRTLPDSFKAQHTALPFAQINGLRNYLVHEYFGVDDDIIWNILQTELIPLHSDIHTVLQQYPL